MRPISFLIAFLLFGNAFTQEKLNYQKPPQAILDLVDAPLAPSAYLNNEGTQIVLLYRDAYKSIAEMSEKEMRLAGLRINPKTNIGSRTRYYNNIEINAVEKIGIAANTPSGVAEVVVLDTITGKEKRKIHNN